MSGEGIYLVGSKDKKVAVDTDTEEEQFHTDEESAGRFLRKSKSTRFGRDSSSALAYDDKPKRILWTPAEVRMLKRGVETFSSITNKNMPWRKILIMGKEVFHESRTPPDLKDKWRAMRRSAHG